MGLGKLGSGSYVLRKNFGFKSVSNEFFEKFCYKGDFEILRKILVFSDFWGFLGI